MNEVTYRFGGLEDGHDLPEQLALPTLQWVPAMSDAKRALDSAAAYRHGVLLLGPKGSGKSVGLRAGVGWFTSVQRQRAQSDSNYRQQHVVHVFADRDATYWDTAVNLMKKLNPRYSEKVCARKKDQNEIRKDVIETALTTHRTLIVVDDCEKASEGSLQFYRDLLAQAEEIDLGRQGGGDHQRAGGIGIVLSGTADIIGRPAIRAELNHRWSQRIQVPQIEHEECARVYQDWLPGLSAHIERVGKAAWKNEVISLLLPVRNRLSLRMLGIHTRLYVLLHARSHGSVRTLEDIAYSEPLFRKALSQVDGGEEK